MEQDNPGTACAADSRMVIYEIRMETSLVARVLSTSGCLNGIGLLFPGVDEAEMFQGSSVGPFMGARGNHRRKDHAQIGNDEDKSLHSFWGRLLEPAVDLGSRRMRRV